MAKYYDDVDKLLDQMSLKDFGYRTFNQAPNLDLPIENTGSSGATPSERASLLRLIGGTEVSAGETVIDAADIPSPSKNVDAIPEKTIEKRPENPVNSSPASASPLKSAFGRIANNRKSAPLSRVEIKLNLPMRKVDTQALQDQKARRLLSDVFKSLTSESTDRKDGSVRR